MIEWILFRPIGEQFAQLEREMELLRQFAEKHPSLKPTHISPYGPTVVLNSTYAGDCKRLFGAEGWTQERSTVKKTVDGVLVELHLQSQPGREVTL